MQGKDTGRFSFLAFMSVLFVSGCAIPFDITTATMTIELPNTYGTYVEQAIEIPAEALTDGVTYSEIILYYTVRKSDSLAADVSLYASTDQVADHAKDPSDEKLIDVHLGLTDAEKSGEVISLKIRDALNNKQPKFVMGCENLSVGLLSSIFIDLELRVVGRYSPF